MLLPRRLQHYFFGSIIALGSIALGSAPQLQLKPRFLAWQNQAIAQTIPPAQATDYAEAYLEIYGSNRMENLLLEVEGMIGKKPDWELRCDDPKSINRLNNQAAIAKVQNFCNKELPALIENIIPRRTFNDISNQLPNNPALRNQIEEAMIDILKKRQGN